MREIKFRAWDEIGKIMRYDVAAIDYQNKKVSFVNKGNYIANHEYREFWYEPFTLMQYAELNDKDGTPIFDGDVIYWEIDNGVGIESYTAVVCWSEDLVEEGWNETYKWLVKYVTDYLRGGFDELCLPAAYNSELRVIGNIYENPELLEVPK